jgi:hypothetical protein
MSSHRGNFRAAAFAVVFVLTAAGLARGAEPAGTPPASPAGWLVIAGKGVTDVRLDQRIGPCMHRTPVDGKVSLTPGEYRLTTIQLGGNYGAYCRDGKEEDWFQLGPGESRTVRIGAPLTPTVRVQRQGRLLRLDYQLLDAEGWNYSPQDRMNPPEFRVYRDGEEIGSGSFEYG